MRITRGKSAKRKAPRHCQALRRRLTAKWLYSVRLTSFPVREVTPADDCLRLARASRRRHCDRAWRVSFPRIRGDLFPTTGRVASADTGTARDRDGVSCAIALFLRSSQREPWRRRRSHRFFVHRLRTDIMRMDSVLPLRCPACSHDGAEIYISSNTVLTVRCGRCSHVWCVDLRNASPALRKQVGAVLHAGWGSHPATVTLHRVLAGRKKQLAGLG